ncbi:MAG: hypothetical protein JWN25_2727 [Verrucomicrobiales bacterium]|nr:hypothetical protein [Verrucomicrobiales bacterium]
MAVHRAVSIRFYFRVYVFAREAVMKSEQLLFHSKGMVADSRGFALGSST